MTQQDARTSIVENAQSALKHHQSKLAELHAGKNLVGDNELGTQRDADVARHQAAIAQYKAILEARPADDR
jgi:hypothetical protein